MYDLAVVGSGPAGLAAAIHGRARNKSVLVAANDPAVSPLAKASRVDNYPGVPAVSGLELVESMAAQATALGAEMRVGRVLSILPQKGTSFLSIGNEAVEARAVILATGVVRSATVPGEEELLGRGVSYCATCDGMFYRGKTVVATGGAPDFREEVAFLRGIGCQVVEVPLKNLKILGRNRVEAVESDGTRIECEGVFLLRPTIALTNLLRGLELEDGHIKVDRTMRTNLPGVYAAGDCTGAPLQIAKAVGEGQMAAHSAIAWLDGG